MKAAVDRDKCIGSGMCTTIAPQLFDMDDDGVLIVIKETPASHEQRSLLDAVACCPVNALSATEA